MSRIPKIEELSFGALGFSIAVINNVLRKRPWHTAFYKHILYTMVGYGCGTLVSYQIDEFRRKKWLHIEDYINAHPEHFPELFAPEKKWKDVFQKWNPNR